MESLQNPQTIDQRLDALKANASKNGFSFFRSTSKSDFIGPDVDVMASAVSLPFHLDDYSVYEDLDKLKAQNTEKFKGEIDAHRISIVTAQWMIMNYFGTTGNHQKREDIYFDDHWNKDSVSMAEFKGKNAAVCLERSALAHNLLLVAGEEDQLLAGDCELNGKPEPHSFNVVKSGNGYYIFDPANPSFGEVDETGNLEAYSPAVYPISDDDHKRLMNGEAIEVEHLDLKKEEGVYKKVKSVQRRIYKFNKK